MVNSPAGRDKKIAVVVGSGGLKAASVIYFYELLEKYQLQPDLIIACSGGTMVSSLWANQFPLVKCQEIIQEYFDFLAKNSFYSRINIRAILNLMHFTGVHFDVSMGIFSNKKFLELIKQYQYGLIENCAIKFVLAATNLETGRQELLDNGPLCEAIYASSALYPLFPPILYQGKWLVDGAYSSSLPIMAAVNMGYEKIIALSFQEVPETNYRSFLGFIGSFIPNLLIRQGASQGVVASYLSESDILFINFKFDEPITFNEKNALSKIQAVGQKTIEKHKKEILHMFGIDLNE